MNNFKPTIVIRHRRENLKKCSLRGLEGRSDFRFYRYPLEKMPPLEGYLLLTLDAEEEISEKDGAFGLLVLDATWRYAEVMSRSIDFPNSLIKRRLPANIVTAYPRKQEDCPHPCAGLASIEAIAAAYALMKREWKTLLDHYYWREAFLQKNSLFC